MKGVWKRAYSERKSTMQEKTDRNTAEKRWERTSSLSSPRLLPASRPSPFRGREWLVSNSPFLPSSTVVCLPSGESPADKHRVPNPIVLVGSTTYGETVANDDDTHGTENAAFARFPRGLGRGKDRPRAPLVVKVTTELWVGSGWRTWTCGHTHVACARRLKSMDGEVAAKMAALGRPRS